MCYLCFPALPGCKTGCPDAYDLYTFKTGEKVVKPLVFNPKSYDAYNDTDANLAEWIESAINQRNG